MQLCYSCEVVLLCQTRAILQSCCWPTVYDSFGVYGSNRRKLLCNHDSSLNACIFCFRFLSLMTYLAIKSSDLWLGICVRDSG